MIGESIMDEKELLLFFKKDAKTFEENLKSKIIDPLKRAEERRDYYTKQREALEEFRRKNKELEKGKPKFSLTDRVFEAFGEQTYTGTQVSKEIEMEEQNMKRLADELKGKKRKPVFLGLKSKIYDINYIPIKIDKEILDDEIGHISEIQGLKMDMSKDEEKYEYIHDPDLYENPPDPESFNTFEEYELALSEWTQEVELALGYVQLPSILGRHYYRPYVKSTNEKFVPPNKRDSIALETGEAETWESLLIPQEPKPEFYDTFEEYESAMKRWTIVVLKTPFLPPHATQFQNLLGIKVLRVPPEYKNIDIEEKETKDKNVIVETKKSKENYQTTQEVRNEWENLKDEDKKNIFIRFKDLLTIKKESKQIYGAFHRFMAPVIHGTFPKPGSKNKDTKSTNFMRRLSLSQFQTNTGQKKTDISTVKEWIISQRADRSLSSVFSKNTLPYYHAVSEDLFHQYPLRRLELDESQIKKSRDCEEIEQGEKVSFDIPDFEIGQVDFIKLKSPDYVRFLQIVLTRIDFGSRYSHFNSWYYPKISKSVHQEKFQELSSIFSKIEHPSQIDPKDVLYTFQTEAFIDVFVNWLNSPLTKKINVIFKETKEELVYYRDLIFASSSLTDVLKQILALFINSESKMVHAKVAFFVLQFLKTKFSEPIIDDFIKKKDLFHLQILTTAVSFFDEVPMNVFRINEQMLESLTMIIRGKEDVTIFSEFINDILTIYYLDALAVSLLEGESVYPQIYPLLLDKMEILIESVEKYIENDNSFLSKNLWYCIGYKSIHVSSIGVFTLSFLMTLAYRPKIYKKFTTIGNLVSNLRKMANLKYSHVQDAIGRIFPMLRKPKWRPLLVDTYSQSDHLILDLMTSAKSTPLGEQPPLITSIALDFISHTLKMKKTINPETKTIVNGLITSQAFGKIISEILLAVEQKRIHQGHTIGAIFLSKFLKYLLCYNLIDIKDDIKGTGTGTSQSGGIGGFMDRFKSKKKEEPSNNVNSSVIKLEVFPSDLVSFLDLICTNFEKSITRKTYGFRTALLDCLRHLLKIPLAFNKLKQKEKLFYQKALMLCKDAGDMEFNRNAWRLFYQTFKFNVGVIDLLKTTVDTNKNLKQKYLLESFFELIYSENLEDKMSANVITTHSIHYFSKMLFLPHRNEKNLNPYLSEDSDDEKEMVQKKTGIGGNVPSDETVKGYLKSIEALCAFVISKDLTKNIEVAYRQLSTTYKGWPFQALALMLWYISKCPSSKKLAESLRKGKEKDSLERIESMFNGPNL